MLKGGIAAQKLVVKPNFVPDPPPAGKGGGDYVVYVGRLLDGKGTQTMLTAWRHLPSVKLKIVGDGALRPRLEAIAGHDNLNNIEFLGMQTRDAVLRLVANAKLLIVPSEWYEGFPMVIAESFACGTPVLASRIGSLEELVEEGASGAKFTAGDPQALAQSVDRLLADQVGLCRMRDGARAYFDAHLTEQQNYAQLISIYLNVVADAGRQPERRRS
jgi:glycosyltransferase involved in cell wall biosynthesis